MLGRELLDDLFGQDLLRAVAVVEFDLLLRALWRIGGLGLLEDVLLRGVCRGLFALFGGLVRIASDETERQEQGSTRELSHIISFTKENARPSAGGMTAGLAV
jgi:hypothetical protein